MRNALLLFLTLATLAACQNGAKNNDKQFDPARTSRKDPFSLSNADSVAPRHLQLDIRVDFDHKQIAGVAEWTIENYRQAKELILDNKGLLIDSVFVDGRTGSFSLGEEVPFKGRALHIPIQANTKKVAVWYRSSDTASATQWLEPQQTAGGKHPFLFTQGETTHTRSWIPCPDGPGIRFPYDARVTVPKELIALMSATNPQAPNDSGVYHFKMEHPVPAYLVALAVGDLRFRAEGNNVGVYSEPGLADRAYFELHNLDKMVDAAESLYGPYRWGRYDVLICPPSFPIGGMENPRLTFATPTIIAGDRSLVNLIAHELAHSWSGNLVTSATWDDIWMNEGFTVYLERRITEQMEGKSYVDMLWELGYQDLVAEVASFGADSRETWLKQDLSGRSADECLSDIPYEKGALLLRLMEEKVGRERFDTFLKNYFDAYAFQAITTEEFLSYLREHLFKEKPELEGEINLKAWVYGPGIPANAPRADRERFNQVDSVLAQFKGGVNPEALKPATRNWSSHEWLYFLRGLPGKMSTAQMNALDQTFRFTTSGNAELAAQWYVLSAQSHYESAYPAIETFLSRIGRQKFLEPIYGALMKNGLQAMARQIFDKYHNNYHPIAQQNIGRLVKGS